MTRIRAFAATAGASLLAVALMLAPAIPADAQQRNKSRSQPSANSRPVGAFTPAVSDPRLAAFLARRGSSLSSPLRFTPATTAPERSRAVRVAIRARASTPAEAERGVVAASSASAVTPITPSSYSLGASLGWRQFAVSGDVAEADGGAVPGRRQSARVDMTYRAARRLTGRVGVAAERSEGTQRLLNADEAYSLDVGGAFSIARNVDVTAGARYRISRDRLDAMTRDERRDSQAVYIGTAFRF